MRIVKFETRVEIEGRTYVRIHSQKNGIRWVVDPDGVGRFADSFQARGLEEMFQETYQECPFKTFDREVRE